MRISPFYFTVALLAGSVFVRAESAATPADKSDSPKQALVAQDAAARAGNVDEDMSFYLTDGEEQKKLAHTIAEGDVALSKLRDAVENKFGKDLATAVVHSAGTEDIADINSAIEKVEGDNATLEWKNHADPLHMTKVDGKWKISLPAMLKGADSAALQRLDASIREMTGELLKIAALVSHNKFRSGEGVRDRVQDLHDRLFGPVAAK